MLPLRDPRDVGTNVREELSNQPVRCQDDGMLPTPIAWTKKILSILKSNLSPNQIAFAFGLGVFAGLPPMGLHVIVPCSLAVLFRTSLRAFLLSMGVFKLLSLALTPAAYALGQWLLDTHRGLDAFWRRLFSLPVVAPMGYERYLLFGSLVLSLVLFVPVFFAVRFLVRRYRSSFVTWVSGWRISQRLHGRRATRLVRRLLVGGEAKYDAVAPPKGPFRFVRRNALIGLPLLYGIAYLIAAFVVPLFAGSLSTTTASWLLGTEVSIEDSSFNLFSGVLTLADLEIQDPDLPSENLIVVPEITLDTGMIHLLEKRVVFDRIRISEAALHVVREEDGTLNVDNASACWDASPYIDWALANADRVDWLGLLRRLGDSLSDIRLPARQEDVYAPYRGGRSFEAYRPPFAVKRLEIGRLAVSLRDDYRTSSGVLPPLTLLEVEVINLAIPAELRDGPATVRLHGQLGEDPDSGFTLSATFGHENGEAVTRYQIEATRIDLSRWTAVYESTLPVAVVSGYATFVLDLALHGEIASGEISLLLEGLQIASRPGTSLFGLSPDVSSQVIDGINRYAADVPVVIGCPIDGSSAQPTVEWEAPLLEIARQGLLMFGRNELDALADQLGVRVGELGGIDDLPIDPRYEAVRASAQDTALQVLSSAVPSVGLPSTEESDEATAQDLIEGLFRSLLGTDEEDSSSP